jgi:hypothetical protein
MKENGSVLKYSDIFYQQNENEILKINIIDEDRFLVNKNIPIGVVWRGDLESSLFYAHLANLNSGIIQMDELEIMNEKFQDKIKNSDLLKLIISPLLQIVENGYYQVFYQYGKSYNFDESYDFKSKRSSVWIEETILPTQDWNTLDQERVDFYKKLILEGNRPTILTLAIANFEKLTINDFKDGKSVDYIMDEALNCINPQFIIDGHHKAKAYIELKEKSSIISLVKLQFKNENENFTNIKDYYIRLIKKHFRIKIE